MAERLNNNNAALLFLANKYRVLGYDISYLEMQKLAYFLQRVGQQSLKLNFKKYHYGPYAHNLQHLLQAMEGYYFTSAQAVLDSKPLDTLQLDKARLPEVEDFVDKNCTKLDKEQLAIVAGIMTGFESPFGLELLATVDWIVNEHKSNMPLAVETIRGHIAAWSARKDVSFTNNHLQVALTHLGKFGKQLGYGA